MTSEASWYYFLNKPSPTKFPVIWFAATDFFQKDIIHDLSIRKVEIILLKNKSNFNSIDGIDSEKRFDIVYKFIKMNYHKDIEINSNELWVAN